MRIYFIGSHSTGKTTMARFVSRRYGLPMISEVARSVLAELEMPLDALRADIDAVNAYQRKVFERQVEVEKNYHGGFVSDRAFDSVAYTAEHATILGDLMQTPAFAEYMDWVRTGIVFYLRPHMHLLKEDGVRAAVDWESVIRIDGMVKLLCEQFKIRYLPVESLNMQERVKAVEFILGSPEVVVKKAASKPRVGGRRL